MQKKEIEIIYQDGNIVVINKPAGLSVTKDRVSDDQLIWVLQKQLGKDAAKLLLIHRLDKDTSGVMILARNTETQTLFSGYFEKRLVRKTYLAIVTGLVCGKEGVINAPLDHNFRNPAIMCIHRNGKESITEWRLLADFGIAALLAVNPLTDRTHQIRVHLPSVGLPLAIDPIYGSSRPLFLSDFKLNYKLGAGQSEKPLIERLTLHAYQLLIPAEAGIQPDCFIAKLDKKFAAAIKMLTKHNPGILNPFANPDDLTKILNGQKL
jgi:23S rRNA pseudouridine1911/1915/1917 synthase